MSDKAVILCVDDDPINISIMEELLVDSYELISTDSGQGCLDLTAQNRPDLILLDVNMPGINGLETCRRLKLDPACAQTPIIFVSALASEAELMAGYEAGGDDYVTKPFSTNILQKKIEVVLASQRSRQELQKISDNAVEALVENRSSSGELGLVVKFLQQSLGVGGLHNLAEKVFDCLGQFGLDCSLLILCEPENLFWFSDKIDRPMERQILESLHGQDRLVSFGTHMAINSDRSTLLVRNIPTEDEKVARLRDHLSILIEGLEARICGLQAEHLVRRRQAELAQILGATKASMQRISESHDSQLATSRELLSKPGGVIDRSLLQLDLTTKQQTILMQVVKSSEKRIADFYQEFSKIDDQFNSILEEISAALEC